MSTLCNFNRRTRSGKLALLASASFAMLSSAAFAQQAPAADASAEQPAEGEAIVVTATRIERSG